MSEATRDVPGAQETLGAPGGPVEVAARLLQAPEVPRSDPGTTISLHENTAALPSLDPGLLLARNLNLILLELPPSETAMSLSENTAALPALEPAVVRVRPPARNASRGGRSLTEAVASDTSWPSLSTRGSMWPFASHK